MAIFLTGATGYIGSYLAAGLLEQHGESLNLLVRADDDGEAQRRLWHSLQLHFDFPAFREHLSAPDQDFSRRSYGSALRAGRRRV